MTRAHRLSGIVAYFLIFLMTFGRPALAPAWWEKGHRIITANAVEALPDDMPEFFKAHAAALIRLSVQPDMWKGFGTELRRAESPDHYCDIEKLTDDPLQLVFHPNRYAALKAIYGKHEDPAGVGLLHYRLVEEFQKLRGVFAQYRRDPDDPSIQQEILVYAGLLAHYAGDGSQPLHMTIHFDGRVDHEGKVIKGKGIHARFEGPFVDKFIEQADCRRYVRTPVVYPDLYDAIRRAFAASFNEVDTVYRLDETGKLETPDQASRTFVCQRLAHGSSFLAGLWYTAWKTSAQVTPSR